MNGFIEHIPLWLTIPFVLMLLFIALGPLFFEEWWENNRNKLIVSLALGIPTSIILITKGLGLELSHQLLFDYVPFIVLLGALFIITGGIHLSGDINTKPWINTSMLAIGGLLASFMGTTGAAMLLIRPVIKANAHRKHNVHTILFFIAIVANAGGILTPLGDPPLFLLYLHGATFGWFFGLFNEWLFVLVALLSIFHVVDWYYCKKEKKCTAQRIHESPKPLRIKGTHNFIFLIGVILSVAFINGNYIPQIHHNHYIGFLREGIIGLMALLSIVTTKNKLRYKDNKFTWSPIIEVTYLFLGIFITMVPALLILKADASLFTINKPWQFYYATGGLSAFLDNAPTAISFFNLAEGMTSQFPGAILAANIPEKLLSAISMGAVFFGSMTYIGNGPNFMVKAIAVENNIAMPSFLGYIFKFSLIVLLPVYVITQLIFM
ncbi:MAG: sodium:proton antiporter [Prolixibacteraceae bacterium]|jgi:Na+/H+ antiporter NhaD/arsenite permease-like protein|nr:sodium:proton antiporter [Prolixibacteraceae bacterium]